MNALKIKHAVIQCALMNSLFSQEYADAHFEGEESENNARHHWEDELLVREVCKIDVLPSSTYELTGIHPTDGPFTYPVSKMLVFNLLTMDNQHSNIAISECLVSSYSLNDVSDEFHLKIEIKDDEPFINPIAGVYIANRDIPSQLKHA
jgi:hypothetical protein